jgi:hypothetical protein
VFPVLSDFRQKPLQRTSKNITPERKEKIPGSYLPYLSLWTRGDFKAKPPSTPYVIFNISLNKYIH